VPFSDDSLLEEADIEINTKNVGSKISPDLSSLNLKWLDHASRDVILCAVIVKFGLSLVGSIAGDASSLRVLPSVVQHQVLKILCPAVDGCELVCLLQVVTKVPKFLLHNNTALHLFTPPCDQCLRCHSQLASYNNLLQVAYQHLNGASKGCESSRNATDAAFTMDNQSLATPLLDGTYTMHPELQLKPLMCALPNVAFWNGKSL